uniref:Exportin-2 n=1 Tax=Ciona savignyi TaxID=51511 RepID=H2YJL6_CIOSA
YSLNKKYMADKVYKALESTLSPDEAVRKQAEKYLENVEASAGYAVMLLKLVDDARQQQQSTSMVPLAAAITFKNFVKRNWRIVSVEDEPSKISEEDRNTVKCTVVDLMLTSPKQYQKQLSEAISIIGNLDFPEKWPSLLEDMNKKFQSGDFHIINGVLQTAHSLFKRYRHEFRSDKLWTEIKHVLNTFAAPLTELFVNTLKLAEQNSSNVENLRVLFSSLVLITKVFYSLNYQDLPEYFEDNMETWMTHFHALFFYYAIILFFLQDDEEAGLVELLKSQICDNVALYAQKYDEEFAKFLPQFVTAVWNLLVNTGKEVKYDLLVSNAIGFLRSVCERQQYKSLFEDEGILVSICEKVIVPNMEFRTADEEQFEDNPEEYIRRDLEGSDVDTRRRAACDLVKGLTKFFEAPVTRIFSQYVGSMLQQYASNPSTNWKSKDAAIYLVTSLAQKGSTAKHGTTQSNQLVNLEEFFNTHILTDLNQENVNSLPVLKSDSIRFVVTFRNQLGRPNLLLVFPHLVRLLLSTGHVVHTYAAHSVERILMIKDGNSNSPLFRKEDILPHLESLLSNIFGAMGMVGSEENEYMMKALLRVVSLAQDSVLPYMPTLVEGLTQKLVIVSKNPNKPHFNHYLFEVLSLCIRSTCSKDKSAVVGFEGALFGIFTDILQRDVTEFIPYVFQVMSLLLELHEPPVPDTYMALFPHLLAPVLWERPGNIPPLVRLMQAFIEKGGNSIGASDKFNNVLGVFQKLIASKSNDHYGFYLLNSMIEFMQPDLLEPFMKQIFSLLFQRLMKSKTGKFVRGILVFFSLHIIQTSADKFQQLIDSIQNRMFSMVLEKLIISDTQKVSGAMERKICSVGMTKLLTSCTALLDENYSHLWAPLLEALIGLFELPQDDSVADDEHFIEIEDTPGYQTAYSQLAFAGKREHDPVKVENPKLFLAQQLSSLSKQMPGKVSGMLGYLNPKAQEFLKGYVTAAQVTIS